MEKNKIIENIAHAMIVYNQKGGQKTWRELATVAYYAYMNCINSEEQE